MGEPLNRVRQMGRNRAMLPMPPDARPDLPSSQNAATDETDGALGPASEESADCQLADSPPRAHRDTSVRAALF